MKEDRENKYSDNLLEIIDKGANNTDQVHIQKRYLTYKKEAVRSFTMTYNMIQKLKGGIIDTLAPGASGWSLLYSSELHGYSLNTLISSAMAGPARGCFILSIIENVCTSHEYERVFGAVFCEQLKYKNTSYGTQNTSLFRFKTPRRQDMSTCPNAILSIYNTPSKNTEDRCMYIMTKKDYLAFGCGDGKFGLQLDRSLLRGESHAVETFSNEVLSHTPRFNVSRVELWHVRI
ncbi:hypothetical protein NEIG_01725 [Nematocida sp. ERTm5]|nr:hypothetical protein NEIRO02_1151 [Nematocida sp. AWRm79]KAI5183479.1 hypothetical protein NEIRO03_1074 [Nematocida sp. AWRm78]OAG32408.1 hypothetical protein NEIG_01725 [Nematocida sp. ERTm5]